jgi:hypothetical protein
MRPLRETVADDSSLARRIRRRDDNVDAQASCAARGGNSPHGGSSGMAQFSSVWPTLNIQSFLIRPARDALFGAVDGALFCSSSRDWALWTSRGVTPSTTGTQNFCASLPDLESNCAAADRR